MPGDVKTSTDLHDGGRRRRQLILGGRCDAIRHTADPPAAAETRAASAGPNDPAPGAPPAVSAVGGSLRVESRPPGAAVRVDDVVMGVTPVDITDVAPGARRVRIELPGYRPWITEVDVSGTERIRVGASLQPEDRQ